MEDRGSVPQGANMAIGLGDRFRRAVLSVLERQESPGTLSGDPYPCTETPTLGDSRGIPYSGLPRSTTTLPAPRR